MLASTRDERGSLTEPTSQSSSYLATQRKKLGVRDSIGVVVRSSFEVTWARTQVG
jgi:hypothetical protein